MRAFCPASITCFFSPVIGDDPRRSGSLGVGIALKPGVIVEVGSGKGVTFNGREVEIPTLDVVRERLGFKGGIRVSAEVPIGCGFGVSGAVAFGTALALTGRRFESADIAHEAEVISGTGLGDVTTQCFGGVVVRMSPSSPSTCRVESLLWNMELDIAVFGGLKTEEILRELGTRVFEIGKTCLKEHTRNPSVENLFRVSKKFSVETGLIDVDERVKDAIEAVESCGGMASMVMLGRAVFAVGGDVLREIGGLYLKARVDNCGARVLD